MIDEERDAFIVKRILVDKHLTLIGGALPGGFYLAPGYFYISALFYHFTHLNPVGMGYVAVFFSIITIISLLIVTSILFNKKIGVISAIFYSFSYLNVIYNRTWWPLTLTPLVVIAVYYCLFQIIKYKNSLSKNNNSIWTVILILPLIVGIQSDPSTISLFLLSIVVWFFYGNSIKNKYVFTAIILLLLSHIPLLLFDIRHDLFNLKALLKFFSGHTGSGLNFDLTSLMESLLLLPRSLARFIWIFGNKDVAAQVAPSKIYTEAKFLAIPTWFLALSIVSFGVFFAKAAKEGKKNIGLVIVATHILISILGIIAQNMLFGNWNYEWLVYVLFPAYSIITAYILSYLYETKILRPVVITAIIVFACFSAKTIMSSSNSYNLQDKIKVVDFITHSVGDQPFSLDSIGQNFALGGYRYLFYLRGKEPVRSYMDYIYGDWLYPRSNLSLRHPAISAVIVNREICLTDSCLDDQNNDAEYNKYLAHTLAKKNIGFIEVLIVDNSENWLSW